MGIISRQGSKSTLVLFFGVLLGYISNLVVFPYCLSPEEIGAMRIIISASTFVAAFIPFGSTAGILKFYPFLKNKKNGHNGLVFLVIRQIIVGIVLFTFIFYLLKTPIKSLFLNDQNNIPFFISHLVFIASCMAFISLLTEYSKTLQRISIPFFLKQIIQKSLIIGTVSYIFIFDIEFNYFFIFLDIIFFVVLIFHILYLYHLNSLNLKLKLPKNDNFSLKQFQLYSFFSLLGGAGFILLDNIDTLMLGTLAGFKSTGIYSISFFIAMVVDMPRRAINQIASPIISEAFKNEDLKKVDEIYKQTSTNNFFIGAFIFLLIWINADNLFSFMPNGETYSLAKNVILIVGTGKLIDISFGLNGHILLLSRYYKLNAVFLISLIIVAISSNYILIPKYGISGAAYGTALTYLIFNVAKHIFLKLKFNLSPFTLDYFKILLIFAIGISLNYFSPSFEIHLIDLILRSVALLLLFTTLYFALKIKVEGAEKAKTLIFKFLKWK